MNVVDFIFRLLHIHKHPTLSVLIPLRLPSTPFANCAHLYDDYENTFGDCTNFFANCAITPDDQMNTIIGSINTPYISSIGFCIPNLALM
jgi:hypothetical protein